MNITDNIFKGDKVIWLIFIALCSISLIEVFSASSHLSFGKSHWIPISQHAFYMLLGWIVVFVTHNIPYKYFKAIPLGLLPISLVLLVVVMFMPKTNGASRFINFFGVQFQPSELAKMAMVLLTANILSVTQAGEHAKPIAFKLIMFSASIVCLLIFPENFSTAMLLFGTIFLMMFVGRVELKKLAMTVVLLGGALILFLLFLKLTPDGTLDKIPMGHRFITWKHRISTSERVPAAKYDIWGKGAQKGYASIAIARSHIMGKGPGNSVERDFLSQAYSDFIYAIIIEELGLVGGFCVMALYIWLLWRIGKLAKKCDRSYPMFLVVGIGLLFATQALFNMMVAVGLAPVTGQPLPLISRGGTSMMINCVYIGMILSVSRYIAAEEEKKRMAAQNVIEESASEAQVIEQPDVRILNIDEELV